MIRSYLAYYVLCNLIHSVLCFYFGSVPYLRTVWRGGTKTQSMQTNANGCNRRQNRRQSYAIRIQIVLKCRQNKVCAFWLKKKRSHANISSIRYVSIVKPLKELKPLLVWGGEGGAYWNREAKWNCQLFCKLDAATCRPCGKLVASTIIDRHSKSWTSRCEVQVDRRFEQAGVRYKWTDAFEDFRPFWSKANAFSISKIFGA